VPQASIDVTPSEACPVENECNTMTLFRRSTQLLIGPKDLKASRDDFEMIGVLNPSVVEESGELIMLVRVVERPREQRTGCSGLPRWTHRGLSIDWIPGELLEPVDPRVVRFKADGRIRLTFTSHLRVVRFRDGSIISEVESVSFRPEGELEEFGVEDPRITKVNDRFYFTYVAVSRHGPATALASTKDFRSFERHGIIFCPENKDVVFFPEKINGAFMALHRPVCGTPFTRPEIWTAKSGDLIHWGDHRPLILPEAEWQSGRVGAGPPPIRVPGGWLAIYHGNRRPTKPGEVGVYTAGAVLLDEQDPSRVRKWLPEPFLKPEADFEIDGFVPNVVFPTGLIRDGETLLVYSGAADECIAVAEFDLPELLASMREPI
jgi:beta-1,2-mannobiose phosphorylase / 1,2-beta-oligomannan phosphorylase